REVASPSPCGSPRVPHHEPALCVVIADGKHRMSALDALAAARHRQLPGPRDRVAHEALVDGETEDERVARGEAAPHLPVVTRHALVADGAVTPRLGVRGARRPIVEVPDDVRPGDLPAGALLVHALYPVADHRARVDRTRVLDHALVVVDEETRGGRGVRPPLLPFRELD